MLINAISYQLIPQREAGHMTTTFNLCDKETIIAVIEKPVIYNLTMKKDVCT